MVTDPVAHRTRGIKVPLRPDVDSQTVPPLYAQTIPLLSIHYGNEILWTNPAAAAQSDDGRKRARLGHPLTSHRPMNRRPPRARAAGEYPSVKNFPVDRVGGARSRVYDSEEEQVHAD